MKKIEEKIMDFMHERHWGAAHSPSNLSKSISIEAAELLECFQWSEDYDKEHVKEELADVLIYSILMANRLGLDVDKIIEEKLVKNAIKYPVK